jgi:FkbM family methyltransferase
MTAAGASSPAWQRARLKPWLIDRVPPAFRTPLRYWYRRVAGRLDRELPILRRYVRPGSRVIDIGANTGLYAYALSRDARVDAFEPMPEALRTLRALAAHRPSVTVHANALSSAPGAATLYVPYLRRRLHTALASLHEPPPGTPFEAFEVPVRTLDAFAFADVSVVKIDVEGHERAVLAGATETLARERPVLLIEIEQRHIDVPIAQVFALVQSLGYEGSFLGPDGAAQSLSAFRHDEHQAPYLADVTDARYVSNFLFLPRP